MGQKKRETSTLQVVTIILLRLLQILGNPLKRSQCSGSLIVNTSSNTIRNRTPDNDEPSSFINLFVSVFLDVITMLFHLKFV